MSNILNKRNIFAISMAVVLVAVWLFVGIKSDVHAGYSWRPGDGAIYDGSGTRTIHHDALTHEETYWVVDKAAWTETVVTGYYCPECGATKK